MKMMLAHIYWLSLRDVLELIFDWVFRMDRAGEARGTVSQGSRMRGKLREFWEAVGFHSADRNLYDEANSRMERACQLVQLLRAPETI
jgi:hypothetical protein